MSNCPICLDTMGAARVILECGHFHCVACFAKWCRTSNQCTCCRTEFTEDKPYTDTKTTIHNSQILEIIEYSRSQNKNENYKNYIEIIKMVDGKLPEDDYEIKRQFNEMIDINKTNVALIVKQFYESN